MQTRKIKIPLYGQSFTLLLYRKTEELTKYFKGYSFETDLENTDGSVIRIEGKLFMCFMLYENKGVSYSTPGIVAHESKHLVNDVFQQIGQKLDEYNDETECYLLQWVVDKVHEALK